MEERGVQNLNLPQGSTEPYTAVEFISSGEGIDISQIEHSGSQLPNLLSNNFFHPPCNQAAHYGGPLHPHWDPSYWPLTTRPTVLSPEQISETSVPMTLAPGLSDENSGNEFRTFADDQIRANGGRPITDQEDFLGGTHDQLSRISPQQLEDMRGTHEFGELQWIPEMESRRVPRTG
ncbi:hypothetical protein DFH94DRAFT_266055 [Russula ochroleuca]|uniref:Uncharacterized protein n=1 Tax=Russula ochroleuca TaxID=152965 RepID=A0A9P5TCL7_9AGAM|nr:hypothetical protein DFH94DRAFT_266055 [Russula ochroleuca]